MIQNNLFKNILKTISVLSIMTSLSLMAFSVTSFAFTLNPAITTPTAPPNTIFTYKGKSVAGNKIEILFNSGEKFTGTVNPTGFYIIDITFPRITGDIQITDFTAAGVSEGIKELPYDITKFAGPGFVVGPVIFSGFGEEPGSNIEVTFDDGTILTALVDSKGNYQVTPPYPMIAQTVDITTQVGVTKTSNYAGGLIAVEASQVKPPDVIVTPPVVIDPVPTTTPPVTTTKPAATTAAKATVRSGGFLPIAGVIALISVILSILVYNKKFRN